MHAALLDILAGKVDDRGVAGVAVVESPGAPSVAVWTPPPAHEPTFLAYSITKTFTAVLMLLLRDEGRLALDDRLARWFPRVAESQQISLRHLLNHTAGIPDYGALPAYQEAVRSSPSTAWSFERFAAETFNRGLSFAPGAGWAYSNPGYMLLKRIAEEATGRSYGTLVAERIARPLGLRGTFVAGSVADLSSLAPAVSRALAPDGTPRDVRHHYHPGWVSHGVVASTPSEIAGFLDALFGGRLVSRQSLDEMTTLVPVPASSASRPAGEEQRRPWRRPSYGLGLMADPESPWGRLWGHNGGGPGYSASAFHAPDRGGVTVAAMVASDDVNAEEIVFAVLDGLCQRRGPVA